ncbi:glycosyltransferase 8 domain-containing protein 2-like isoform X2 [Pomacea canaliculata]|uniref:glycosyltransferase 8 domain-containing protein 2-like isoform X2 n=1 Tax=Pomacea canaliculata TaxID=400727 RepID=UPI000D72F195|nr:glycosyltransferase 8 domain-containing protein 2-like isoform X2 [Pomacea canaliculata]
MNLLQVVQTASSPLTCVRRCRSLRIGVPWGRKTRQRVIVSAAALCVFLMLVSLKGGPVILLPHLINTLEQRVNRTVSTPLGMDKTSRRLVDLDTVHVAIFADEKLFPGVVTLTNSIVSNTASPVTFHFVTFPSNATLLRSWITGSKLRNITFEIVEFPVSILNGKYRSSSSRKELSNPLNFARFYLQTLFPKVGKIIYMDCDCLVLGNIKELYNIQLDSHHPVSLLRMCDLEEDFFSDIKNLLNFSNPDVIKASISSDACILNNGVFVADLIAWDQLNISQQLEYWMTLNTRSPIYREGDAGAGSQAPMNMVFHNRNIPLPPEWNMLSGRHKLNLTAKLIHWNGRRKPWMSCKSLLWNQYSVPDPSGRVKSCESGPAA